MLTDQEHAVLIELGKGLGRLEDIKKSLSALEGMAYMDCEMQV